MRVEAQAVQSGNYTPKTTQEAQGVSFAAVMAEKRALSMAQAEQLRNRYWGDRKLEVAEARELTAELSELGVLDAETIERMQEELAHCREGEWLEYACFRYMNALDAAAIAPAAEGEGGQSFKEFLLDPSSHAWANEWGKMATVSDGTLTQLGPGFHPQSTGDRELTAGQIEYLKEKYLSDRVLSFDDARYLIGELSQMGVVDGKLAMTLEIGPRNFSKQDSRIAINSLDALIQYLAERHEQFALLSLQHADYGVRTDAEDQAGKYEKLLSVLEEILGA